MAPLDNKTLRMVFQMSFAGEPCEQYWAEVTIEPLAVDKHDIPTFVPLNEIIKTCVINYENHALEQFTWSVYRYLQAAGTRRKELDVAKVQMMLESMFAF